MSDNVNNTAGGSESRSDAAVNNRADSKEVVDLGRIARNYMRHWWLFLISLIVCLGLGYLYLHKKSPVYLITGLIMVNHNDEGGVTAPGGLTAMMASFGMGGNGSVSPDNEQLRLMSHTNLTDVVNVLGLQTAYWIDNGLFNRKGQVYKNSPFKVEIPQAILDTIHVPTLFRFETDGKSPVRLTVKQAKGKVVLETDLRSFPYRAKTPYGTFNIDTTAYYMKGQPLNLCCMVQSTADAVNYLNQHLAVSVVSNKSDALQVDMEEACVDKGIDIVNATIDIYNERLIKNRYDNRKEALDFIETRLVNLYNELEASESKIQRYKQDNQIVNAEAEAEYIFTRKGVIEQNMTDLTTKTEIYEMVRQMLTGDDTKDALIPFTGGQLGLSESFYRLIEGYNNLILERMQMAASAKPNSATMSKMDAQIDALRENVLNSVNRELQGSRIALSAINAEQGKSNSRMGQIPRIEHELVALYRDREVKNQIYAYLLQKREETQIQLAENDPVAQVIDYGYAGMEPIAPKRGIIMASAFVIGLVIPAVYLQLFSRRRKEPKHTKSEKKD